MQDDQPINGRMPTRVGRMMDRAVPWILGAAVCVASVASAQNYLGVFFPAAADGGSPVSAVLRVLIVVCCLVSGVAAALARYRRWPVFAVAAVGWLWLALWPAVIVASYYAGATLRRRVQVVAFGVGALAVAGASVGVSAVIGGVRYITTGTFPNAGILMAVLVGFPLAVGLWVGARRQATKALRDRAERLEREQRARTDQARAQERTRIAREMHDVVAHRVSLMVLHAGALEVGTVDERTAETAALIRGIGREALADLRDVLGVLRSPNIAGRPRTDGDADAPQPTLADLDGLLEQSRRLGIRVARRDEGVARPLPALVERTAYRIVQEALTNVHKHAADASTEVVLRYRPAGLEIAVRNGPSPAPEDLLPGAGLGLSGLRERVELLGGEFRAHREADGGFGVRAQLPAGNAGEPS